MFAQPRSPKSPARQGGAWRTTCYIGVALVAALVLFVWAPDMPGPAQDAMWIFYQPVAHILCMAWLWSVVIWFFETHLVRYEACFASEHLRFLLSSEAIRDLTTVFTLLTGASLAAFVYMSARGYLEHASYQPPLLYLAIGMVLANPLDWIHERFYTSQRWFLLDTLRRVVLPIQTVHFTDFLLADILTSLAKPISDLGLAACHLLSDRPLAWSIRQGFHPETCSNHSWQIPLVLALPYAWRLAQCLIVARTTGDAGQLLNALKYSTAFPVVFLSFVKYSVPLLDWRATWKPLWVLAAVLNTSYSFFWDVERDWDIKLFTGGQRPLLKTDVRMFHRDWPYFCLVAVNFVLRVSWTYKLSSHLRHLRWFVMAMTLLEICRRFLWSFVRIEHELRKIAGKQPTLGPLIPNTPKRKHSAATLLRDAHTTTARPPESAELQRRHDAAAV